jgi:hypothetical protein
MIKFVLAQQESARAEGHRCSPQPAISKQNYEWRLFDNDDTCFDYNPALLCLRSTFALHFD